MFFSSVNEVGFITPNEPVPHYRHVVNFTKLITGRYLSMQRLLQAVVLEAVEIEVNAATAVGDCIGKLRSNFKKYALEVHAA